MRVVELLGDPLKLVTVLDVSSPLRLVAVVDWLGRCWLTVLTVLTVDLCRPLESEEIGETRMVNDWLSLVVGRAVPPLLLEALATTGVLLLTGALLPAGVCRVLIMFT